MTEAVLSNTEFWGEDLTKIPGLCEEAAKDLEAIEKNGAYGVMEGILNEGGVLIFKGLSLNSMD